MYPAINTDTICDDGSPWFAKYGSVHAKVPLQKRLLHQQSHQLHGP